MKGKQIVNFLAYISVALIGVVLLVGKVLNWLSISADVVTLINIFAQTIAYVITAVYAFSFAKAKRNIAWLIVYIVAIVLIVVFTGFNLGSVITSIKN